MEEGLIKGEEVKKRKKDYGKVIRIKDRELADLIKSFDEKELKSLLEKYKLKQNLRMRILKLLGGDKDG